MSRKIKTNGKFYCIDCGEELKDFNYKIKTINPDDQKFSDNTHDLFHELNGGRRFFCHKCDLGFAENEIINENYIKTLNKRIVNYALGLLDLDQKTQLYEEFCGNTYDNKSYKEFINNLLKTINKSEK